MALLKSQLDPSTLVDYSHAAAGHDGVRSDPTGAILIKPCTRAEVDFYESATASHPAFRPFMPTFMGTLTADEVGEAASTTTTTVAAVTENSDTGNQVEEEVVEKEDMEGTDWVPSGGKMLDTGLSIVLENITTGFKRPNVIDLKLGARLWADDSPVVKRRRLDEVSATTTSGSLGFRIAGMKVYRPSRNPDDIPKFWQHIEATEDGYLSYNKFYGRSFKGDEVLEAFVQFLGGDEHGKPMINETAGLLADRLRQLTSVLEKEESRFYSASVLVVYEGDEEALKAALEQERQEKLNPVGADVKDQDLSDENEDDEEQPQKPKACDLRMIDFAHAQWTPGQGSDENVLQGTRSVLKIFEQLARRP